MSQFWHAHWVEDSYSPTKLQNWEIPRWHAKWPNRHCTITKCIAHSNGRIYPHYKPKCKPEWSSYKGTWELPLKIDRCTAEKLARFTECNKIFWDNQKKKHNSLCNKTSTPKIVEICNKNKRKIQLERKSDSNRILESHIKTIIQNNAKTSNETKTTDIHNVTKILNNDEYKYVPTCMI